MKADPYTHLINLVNNFQESFDNTLRYSSETINVETLIDDPDGIVGITSQQESLIENCRSKIQQLMEARAERLCSEASDLPPTHFLVISLLTGLILAGYTVSTLTIKTSDGMPVQESRLIFAALTAVYVLFFNFAIDLNGPFDGVYQLRRSAIYTYLLQIKNFISQQTSYSNRIQFNYNTGINILEQPVVATESTTRINNGAINGDGDGDGNKILATTTMSSVVVGNGGSGSGGGSGGDDDDDDTTDSKTSLSSSSSKTTTKGEKVTSSINKEDGKDGRNDDDNEITIIDEECIMPEDVEKEKSKTEQLMEQVKDAGVAGIISYALWELGFWTISVPICIYGYKQYTGHWPDLQNQDDIKQLGTEAFAFVNLARFAVPIRIGLALSTTPWIDTNIVSKFKKNKNKKDELEICNVDDDDEVSEEDTVESQASTTNTTADALNEIKPIVELDDETESPPMEVSEEEEDATQLQPTVEVVTSTAIDSTAAAAAATTTMTTNDMLSSSESLTDNQTTSPDNENDTPVSSISTTTAVILDLSSALSSADFSSKPGQQQQEEEVTVGEGEEEKDEKVLVSSQTVKGTVQKEEAEVVDSYFRRMGGFVGASKDTMIPTQQQRLQKQQQQEVDDIQTSKNDILNNDDNADSMLKNYFRKVGGFKGS